jgi:hypothetical protein
MAIKKSDAILIDDSFESKNIDDVFLSYRSVLIAALQKSLQDVDRVSSAKLYQSIEVDIERGSKKISFELKMEDYWKFVDEGRKAGGKMPPIDAILKFINFRRIKPINNKKIVKDKKAKKISRDRANKQLAYLIARKIQKRGIKPTHFYSNVVNNTFKEQFKEDISKAFKGDVLVSIRDIKKSLNG